MVTRRHRSRHVLAVDIERDDKCTTYIVEDIEYCSAWAGDRIDPPHSDSVDFGKVYKQGDDTESDIFGTGPMYKFSPDQRTLFRAIDEAVLEYFRA